MTTICGVEEKLGNDEEAESEEEEEQRGPISEYCWCCSWLVLCFTGA